PSGTKLRTWDELKNYICSDGTCKCGLSCPLRLEQSFSFDPKVTNSCQAEESSVEENVNETTGTETPPRLLCNHKRKIPKSEDSPLISSTRDDLVCGYCGCISSYKLKTFRVLSGDLYGWIHIITPATCQGVKSEREFTQLIFNLLFSLHSNSNKIPFSPLHP
ncbi:unnamed protein product, partial [Allacma fusca]